ncbi:MAG TPA: hypothetical protein VFA07_16660 [Chthonomonadaceae bacterium]|nr:hypothetical protein [Chthonomonadaceae bacterium]
MNAVGRLYRRFFVCLALGGAVCGALRAQADTAVVAALWPSTQRQIWLQMQAGSSPWLPYLFAAASDATGQTGIENNGTAAGYAYLYTRKASYAANAWSAIKPWAVAGKLPSGDNNNSIRIYFGLYALVYAAIQGTLSPPDRQLYVTWMNGIAARARGGFFSGNANGLCGEYLGLCLWSLISQQPALLAGTWKDSGVVKPFGGLTYDPALGPRGSARNAIHDYVVTSYPLGTGQGCWLEGKQYRDASLFAILLFTLYIDRLVGQDCFPEVTAALPQIANDFIGTLVPGLDDGFSWGDDEFPHDLHLSDHLTTACILAYRLGTTAAGNQLRFLIDQWVARYGYKDFACRAYLALNPLLPVSDFRQGHLPLLGTGLSIYRSGWGASDSVFGALSEPNTGVNHTGPDRVFRSFMLWRKGAWVLDKMRTYGGPGLTPDGNNTVVAGGIGAFLARGEAAWEAGQNTLYHRAETYGPLYGSDFYKPAPPFVSEQTGSVFFAHGANATCDVIFVADRVNAGNPMTPLTFPNGWRAYDADLIQNAEGSVYPAGPLQWLVRSPVAPAVAGSTLSWTTDAQQVASIDLSPVPPQDVSSLDEAQMNGSGGYVYFTYGFTDPGERHWQTRETWSDGQPYHFLLHVLTVRDAGQAAPGLASVNGPGVAGALVEPVEEAGVLALFASDPAGRVLGSSFRVSYTCGNKETDVVLPDLDPSKSWTAYEDGRPGQAIVFGSGGVGRVTFYQNRGKHVLTLIAN